MKGVSKIVVVAALTLAFGSVLAPAARASCVSLDEQGGAGWRLAPSSVPAGGLGLLLQAGAAETSIVGFWRVDFTAQGDTEPFDSAYVQWHSDGTEIMNSSRDPRTQSFCLGVWKKTGPFTYTLKHLAMSWDGAGHPVGPATILENVTLALHGDMFTGTFTLTQYAMDGTTVLPPTPIAGTLAGTRIMPD
jgi:hypothetical protein